MSPATALPPACPPAAQAVFGDRLDQAVRYAELLCRAGVERGLLGPREAERIWGRHLLNSAALAPLVPGGADVVDIGSGAGLPGIPLALARPDLRIVLLEPMQRRASFLGECVAALDLPVDVLCARAQDATLQVEVAVVRALAPLDRLMAMAAPLIRPGGALLALKGRRAVEEVASLDGPARGRFVDVEVLECPAGADDDGAPEHATVVRARRRAVVAAGR